MRTFKASIFASVIGTGACVLGLTRKIWPAHPQCALVLLTFAATVVLLYVWPDGDKQIN